MAAVGSPSRITMSALAVVRCAALICKCPPVGCWRLTFRISFEIRRRSSASACFFLFRSFMGFDAQEEC